MTRALAVAVLASLACSIPLPLPMPRVLSATPSGEVAPDQVAVEITASAPLDPAGISDGRYFALCREEDVREVLKQAESEEGISAEAPVIAAQAALDESRTRARLVPAAPLDPERRFAAVFSERVRAADGRRVLDPGGRAASYVLVFATGPAVDRGRPRPRWLSPPHGPVPFNLAALQVGFDEPVAGALALAAASPSARAFALAADALGLEFSGPLASGALGVDLAGVHDAAGNEALPLEPIAVSACAAESAPPLGDAQVTPGDLSVDVQVNLAGMGRLVAEFSALAGEGACGIAPEAPASAIVAGGIGPCPGHDPCAPASVACVAAVSVRGVCPGRALRLRLASEDLAGHRGDMGGWTEVRSLPARPVPVLTEVLADADAPEAGGEFAEVANVGTGDADLSGFALAKRSATGTFSRCKLAQASGGPIAPGGHALVVGGAYDGRYALPPGTPVYHCGSTALAGGLANDRPVALALEDAQGAVVSSMGIAEPAPRCAAGSLERVIPGGPDAVTNVTCGGTTTPGACNQSTPVDSCPKRPW